MSKEIWRRRRRGCFFCRGGESRVSLLILVVVGGVEGKGEEGGG